MLISHCTSLWKLYPESIKYYIDEIITFLLYREPVVELEDGDFSEYNKYI